MTGYCLPADRSRANREDENSILGLNGLSAALLQRHGARVLYPPAAAASHDSGPPPRPTVYRAHTLFVPATLLQSAVRDALNAVLADVGMKLEAVGTDDEFKLPQLAVLVPAEPKGGDPVLPVVVDAWVALQALRAAARRNVQDLQQYQPEIDQVALERTS